MRSLDLSIHKVQHLRQSGTVPRQRNREAHLGNELLGSILVTIVGDIAIIISISSLAHEQVYGVAGLKHTTVRVGISIVVARVLCKSKRKNESV